MVNVKLEPKEEAECESSQESKNWEKTIEVIFSSKQPTNSEESCEADEDPVSDSVALEEDKEDERQYLKEPGSYEGIKC